MQLHLIECAYEVGQIGVVIVNDYSQVSVSRYEINRITDEMNAKILKNEKLFVKAAKFGDKYYGDNKSGLIAIMKNVIKNNGTFKP